jgi:hypothetical protein
MRIFKERTEWVDIPNDKEGGAFLLKYLNEGDQIGILARSGVEADDSAYAHGLKSRVANVEARLKDWRNMNDEDGKPLEFNEENRTLVSNQKGFTLVFSEMTKQLDLKVEAEREQEEKNLPKSQGGSPG